MSESDRAQLEPLQSLVGGWKGVGQRVRGSNRGAWIEEADWRWDFSGGASAIVFAAPQSDFVVTGRITVGADDSLHLKTSSRDGTQTTYSGKRDDDGAVVFNADADSSAVDGLPARISIRLRADGARLVVLLERRNAADGAYTRLAEIGYTRRGSDFGQGGGKPECVVTGGAGTIPVTHAGVTYYVCCSGCKELFEAEPEKILADYAARKEAERKKIQ